MTEFVEAATIKSERLRLRGHTNNIVGLAFSWYANIPFSSLMSWVNTMYALDTVTLLVVVTHENIVRLTAPAIRYHGANVKRRKGFPA